jgi:signal peptidase I
VVRGLVEVPIIAALAVLIVVVLRTFIVQPFYIPSASMVPQLQVNDKILVSRLSYRLHGVHRGDIIVFNAPPGVEITGSHHGGPLSFITQRLGLTPRTDVLVKRVIGLPGETVEGRGGHVYVNGKLLVEPYLPTGPMAEPDPRMFSTPTFAPTTVPSGQLWVMGDQRGDSEDSHIFGPIQKSSIIGRAIVKMWPLSNLSFL